MKRIEVSFNLEVVAPLLDFIQPIIDSLAEETALAAELGEADRELQELWDEGLIANQVSDCEQLLQLFDEEFFATGRIAFTPENADHVLRAASAIRLKLREVALEDVADEVLESGDIELDTLSDDERLGFAAYLFLATLQEIIIKYADPG